MLGRRSKRSSGRSGGRSKSVKGGRSKSLKGGFIRSGSLYKFSKALGRMTN